MTFDFCLSSTSAVEIHLFSTASSKQATKDSRELMRTQYEWLFTNITVSCETINSFGFDQDVIIYTVGVTQRAKEPEDFVA